MEIGEELAYTNLVPPYDVEVTVDTVGVYEVWVTLENVLTTIRVNIGNVRGTCVN